MGLGISNDELWRRLERLDNDTRERFRAVDDRITAAAYATVPREVYEERDLALRDRVGIMEDTAKRALVYRRNMLIAVVGALVAAIGAVVASLVAVTVH